MDGELFKGYNGLIAINAKCPRFVRILREDLQGSCLMLSTFTTYHFDIQPYIENVLPTYSIDELACLLDEMMHTRIKCVPVYRLTIHSSFCFARAAIGLL